MKEFKFFSNVECIKNKYPGYEEDEWNKKLDSYGWYQVIYLCEDGIPIERVAAEPYSRCPEDHTFKRSLHWVTSWLNKSLDIGRKDVGCVTG
jgi:hypothetical protein